MVAALREVSGSFLPAAKRAMALVGLECGPVRPPLRNLGAGEARAVEEGLARLGFEAFRCR